MQYEYKPRRSYAQKTSERNQIKVLLPFYEFCHYLKVHLMWHDILTPEWQWGQCSFTQQDLIGFKSGTEPKWIETRHIIVNLDGGDDFWAEFFLEDTATFEHRTLIETV